jgi:hypothetical protein
MPGKAVLFPPMVIDRHVRRTIAAGGSKTFSGAADSKNDKEAPTSKPGLKKAILVEFLRPRQFR